MSLHTRMIDAMTHNGNRLLLAWKMARASYAYTASFIGQTDPSAGEPEFTRWCAFKGAVELFIEYATKREPT